MDRVYPPEHGHRLSVRSRRPLRAQTLNFSSFANPHVHPELQTQRSRGHVLPAAPFASQHFVAQGARGHTSFSTFNSEPFVSNSAVPLSVRLCASKGAHVNNNAHPTVPSGSALTQPNHLDTHAQLLISQVVRGQLNRESQIGAACSLPAVSSSTPSQPASSSLTANGLPGPSRCRRGTVSSGTDPTHMRMVHWSQMLDPDCNTGNRVHVPSPSCQKTNSPVVTNASFAHSGVSPKAHMSYRPIPFEQLNSQLGSPHRPTNTAYGSLTSGPYPTSQSLAKSLNPVVHSVQPSPRTKGHQNFLSDPAMHYTSDYVLHPGVRSTAEPQVICYPEGRNSNLPSTNTRVTAHAQAPMINPCSANQFANPQSSSLLVHLRNDLASPSTNALQNSNSGAFSALSLERSTPSGASRVVSSSQPSLYEFQPQATSNRLALCFDPSNSRQSTVTYTAEAGVSSRLSALLTAASPITRVQAQIADIGSAQAREEGKNSTPHACTPKTPEKMKGRTPKRYRPRKKQPTTKSSELNSSSNMTIERTDISRSIFSETAPRMQGHNEKSLQTGAGDNSQQKGIQSGDRGVTCGEHYPNVSRPAASELRSRLPGFIPTTDLRPEPTKSNEELAHASPRPVSTAVRTGDRDPVLHSSEAERHPSHSERNVMHRIPLQLRLKASASVYSPASDDTQTPLTPRSTGDQSSPDATSLGDTNSEEAVKRKKESHRSTLTVSGVDMKQNGEKKLTQSQLAGAVKNQTSVLLKLRIRRSKTKSTRRAALSKRSSFSTKASGSKHGSLPARPQRQSRARSYTLHGAAELTRQRISSDECTDIKSMKTQSKSRIACGKQAMPKKARVSDTEVMTKKSCSSTQKTVKCDDQLMEAFARKGRTSDFTLITPVPIQEPRANLRLKPNDFDAELANLQREGHIKPPQPFCQTEAAKSEALSSRKLSCLLCTECVIRSQAFIHPRFPAKNFFLCRKCYDHVNSRVKAESSMVHVAISDSPSDVLRRVSLFVMVVENIIQGFPPSERDTREIAKVHACVSSRNPADLRKRAELIDVPFQTTALLRVVLRRLGVTIQRNRLRWRLQPIRLPSCPDLIEIISHAIPPSLEDMIRGSTPGRDVWNKVFPDIKLDTSTPSFRIVSNLMALIGVRLRHLCVPNSSCLGNQDGCLVQFDLLSVCSAMHRARVMVSGTIVECLFRVWDPDAAARYLEMTDTRLANGTSTGRLSNTCSICTRKQDGHSYPFRFFSCLSCSHEFCSVCVANILSPSEYALANAGAYKCLLCRVDATVHAKLLRGGCLNEVVAKTKMANGNAAQNSSKSRPQLPMLIVSRDVRKQVMSDENSESRAQMVGFAKFCEEANSHICEIGPTCSEARAPSFAFPTKAAAIDGNGFEERCFSCKLPVENQVCTTGGHRQLLQDEQPSVLRCVNENCGVVMHRECSPPDQSRRRRAGRPKWSCPRHKCHVCANRDDSRLFKCRTCALALCKEHMFKPSELYLYSEKLFACKECMKNLRAPRPCLMDRLPKRQSEFIQALNVPQAKRRRLAEKGMSEGLPPSYPGCIE